MIEEGYCVLGDFDEYYVPGKSSYREKHFPHNYLICGVDRTQRFFILKGYNKAGQYEKYGESLLPFDDYIAALKIREESFPFDVDIWRNLEYKKLKYENLDKEADLEMIKNGLTSFLNPKKETEGLNVFNIIIQIIDEVLDLRNIRLILEHAEVMFERAYFFNNLGLVKNGTEVMEKLDSVKKKAEVLFNLSLLAEYKGKRKDKVREFLINFVKCEKEALEVFLAAIL